MVHVYCTLFIGPNVGYFHRHICIAYIQRINREERASLGPLGLSPTLSLSGFQDELLTRILEFFLDQALDFLDLHALLV